MRRVLFVASEIYPLVKTGGLADVAWSLPLALRAQGQDVVVAIPGYPSVLSAVDLIGPVRHISGFGLHPDITWQAARLADTSLRLWIIRCPALFERQGGPYDDGLRQPWPDNPYRFGQFCRAVVELACYCDWLDWQPEIVHCHDWQTGLIPALLSLAPAPPASVFTIHNLAYQGVYSRDVFDALALPPQWWHSDGVEFHGRWSFLKAGIVFANAVTTVSPSYAEEILTAEQGYGMDGVLRAHQGKLQGILNGVDYTLWNPATDPYLPAHYDMASLNGKRTNKSALQRRFGLREDATVPLLVMVSRLAFQKGVDLVITALQQWSGRTDAQWLIVGMGEPEYEQALRVLVDANPKTMALFIGYDEALAHQVEAGGDLFLMPSRYEPCGLNQIYSLRYGTVPIVKATGGLRDTVVDTSSTSLAEGSATGFCFTEHQPAALVATVERALACYANPDCWQRIQRTGMQQQFGWEDSASQYIQLYQRCSH